MFYGFRLWDDDLTSTDFFSIVCQIFSCAAYIANLQEFGFPKIYLNTKVIFMGHIRNLFLMRISGTVTLVTCGVTFLNANMNFLLVRFTGAKSCFVSQE